MPLQKQNIPISFADGLDTKTDAKQVLPGKLSALENGVFTNIGQINKRNGYAPLPTAITPAGNITTAQALTTFQDELILFDGYTCYSYLPSAEAWISRGDAFSAIPTNTQVLRNDSEQNNPDMATLDGLQCFAWEDSRGGIRYTIRDAITGSVVVNDSPVRSDDDQADCRMVKVLPFEGCFALLYCDADEVTLQCAKISTSTPALISDIQIADDGYASPSLQLLDACVAGSRLYFLYNNGSDQTALKYLDNTYTAHAGITIAQRPLQVSTCFDGANVWVCYQRTDNSIRAAAYDASALTTTLADSLVTSSVGTLNTLNIAPEANSTGEMRVLYEVNNATSYNTLLNTNTITIGGTHGTAATLLRSVGMAGKQFAYNGIGFVPITYESNLQNTYFVARIFDGLIVAKINAGLGGGLRDNTTLAEVQQLDDHTFAFANCVKDPIIAEAGIIFSLLGVNSTSLDFQSSNAFVSTQVGRNLLVSGGVIQGDDGIGLTEFGFHLFPENITYASNWLLVSETIKGDGSHKETTAIDIGAGGSTFVGGSYIQWQTAGASNFAVWWKVDGVGVAPSITSTTILGPALLLSTDNATSVATKITAQMSGSGFTATSSFNAITLQNSSNGAAAATTMTVGPNGVYNGNGIADGYFQYCATYEWTDNFGQVQRSAPSIPVTVTVPPTGMTVSILSPTLRLTQKTGLRDDCRIVIYRTQNNSTLFYRVTSSIAPLKNSTTADTVTFIDSIPDTALISNELAYTTGGILENIAPPSGSIITTYRNRAWIAGLDDPNKVWFSKVLNDITNLTTIPVEFNDSLTLSVDARGGAISALGVLDDKLIIFKQTAIFEIAGDGPDATGNNSDYGDPVVLSSTVGCTNPNSVVITPNGLMFKTLYGIYLLDRSGQLNYTGAPVEAYNDLTITSATVIDDQQVIFTTLEGTSLVYDYYFDKWSVFTNQAAVDSTLFGGEMIFVNANGTVNQYNDTFTDHTSPISMTITTGWLSLAGLQGYSRVYALYILGTFKSNHTLTVSISYNFIDAPSQTTTIDTSTVDLTDPYQFRVFLAEQKCESIKISISDAPQSPYGEGFAISALTLLIGTKTGAMRIPSTKTFGA